MPIEFFEMKSTQIEFFIVEELTNTFLREKNRNREENQFDFKKMDNIIDGKWPRLKLKNLMIKSQIRKDTCTGTTLRQAFSFSYDGIERYCIFFSF